MTILAIAKRELRGYFDSPIAYVFICLFLALSSFLFLIDFFAFGVADPRPFFDFMPYSFLLFLPALTMRLWSEERKMRTLEILFTLPVRTYEAVLGKFLAAWGLLLVTLLMSVSLPITVTCFTESGIDVGPVLGSYLGAALLGSVYIAFGLVVSFTTENQVIAFVVTVAGCTVLLIIGNARVIEWVGGLTAWMGNESLTEFVKHDVAAFLEGLGLASRFESIARGVVDSRDVGYYTSLVGFLLVTNVVIAEHRRS